MKNWLYVFLILFLPSCVEVGYQPYNMMSGGYKDRYLGSGKYFISYEAYGRVNSSVILGRWHKRANEICIEGYKVLNLEKESKDSAIPLSSNDTKYSGSVLCKNWLEGVKN